MHEGTAELLGTKLHAPGRRRALVDRPRLLDRLRAGRTRTALTLVSAPAGFGKTTLLAEWVAREPRAAWLSLDPGDNDPAVFWAYVVAALRTVEPDVGGPALAALASAPTAPEPVVAALVNDLGDRAGDVVLVLDDHHVIDAPAVHDGLAYLLDHLPSGLHLVIGTRADPPLPLPRLRARGELTEVRAADLRFTVDEAAAYLTDAMGLALAPGDVQALEGRTEGWIAALQLAALSLQGREDVGGFVATFAGDDRFVVDYLVEEVLDRQDAATRAFLLRTSVLDRLTGALCDAVTGTMGGRVVLEALDRANLFLVPLDDQRRWYRYHHLFGDLLRARLLDEHPDLVPELHRRASAWLEDHGDRPAAIDHAVRGGDLARAAELVERAAPQMRRTRQEATLRRWLEAIPPELLADRPVLSTALVGARMATGDTTGVDELLRGVEAWLDPDRVATPDAPAPIVFDHVEHAHLPTQVEVYRAGLALLGGDLAATTRHAGRALERSAPTDHFQRGAASALLGLAAWAGADLATARGHYAESVRCFVAAGFLPDVLGVSLTLADIQAAQGDLGAAARTLEEGLRITQDHPGLRGAADMHVALSAVLLERDEREAAGHHLRAARDLGEHAGLPQHPYRWRVATARLRLAEGDPDAARALLDEAERVYDTDFSPSVQPIPAVRARVDLAVGDVAGATRWADDRGLRLDDEPAYLSEYEHITLVRTHLAARDDLDATLALADRLLAAAVDGGRGRSAIELLVLRAIALGLRGDREAARAALQEALARAAAGGHVRVFADEGARLDPLLHAVAADGDAGEHARRILAARRPAPAAGATPPAPVEALSGRERDVLRLLRSDLSGPEIARELHISLNTLRTHTRHIHAKLGVRTRREAVRRADELGL